MADTSLSRKKFLKIAGASAAALWGLAGCELNSIPPEPEPPGLNLDPDPRPNDYAVYLGSGDTALFNFIYILEQLEAAFFTRVVENPYPNMSDEEERIFNDIQQHEVAHRDFYNAFLGENGVQQLQFEFFSTDFSNRLDVLGDARWIEDIIVSMYNHIGELFENPDYLNPIIKIASVEARHAAAMRNVLQPNSSFFIGDDIITPNGLDAVNTPNDVSSLLFPFVVENVDMSELPRP